jgi:peptide-methionine (S)-S-oxide reductase
VAQEQATLAGGCFWCLEAVYQRVRGVERVVSGYAGGHTPDPSYRAVCSGTTGHAEVVQLTFDPQTVSYADLLRIFFTIHDPTQLNRQGYDVGTQYRSAIFTHSAEQETAAREAIAEQANVWGGRIVTQVASLSAFYPAEDYHQDYFNQNAEQPYCQAVIVPKVAKLRAHFLQMLRAD